MGQHVKGMLGLVIAAPSRRQVVAVLLSPVRRGGRLSGAGHWAASSVAMRAAARPAPPRGTFR
jgi:hypothetical protein